MHVIFIVALVAFCYGADVNQPKNIISQASSYGNILCAKEGLFHHTIHKANLEFARLLVDASAFVEFVNTKPISELYHLEILKDELQKLSSNEN